MRGEETALHGLRELTAIAHAADHQQLAARFSFDRLDVGRRQREAVAPQRRAGRPRVSRLHEQRARVVRAQHAGQHAVQARGVRRVVGVEVGALEQRAAAFDVARVVALDARSMAVERDEAKAADLEPARSPHGSRQARRNEQRVGERRRRRTPEDHVARAERRRVRRREVHRRLRGPLRPFAERDVDEVLEIPVAREERRIEILVAQRRIAVRRRRRREHHRSRVTKLVVVGRLGDVAGGHHTPRRRRRARAASHPSTCCAGRRPRAIARAHRMRARSSLSTGSGS